MSERTLVPSSSIRPFTASALAVAAAGLVLACGPEARQEETASLATFDSILTELGGSATAALDRGQRWRMISSTGAGLPPLSFSPDLLPEQGSRGARLVQFYCVQCHGLPVPHMHTAEEWPVVVRRMLLRTQTLSRHMGGQVTERLMGEMRMAGMAATEVPSLEERDTLLAYLQRHAFPGITTRELPDGPGRDAYIHRCATCHAAPDPAAHGPEEWTLVLARMQGNMSAMDVSPLTDEERAQILGYLERAAGRR